MNALHELTIERVMDAPVAAVWRAWTGHLAEWWCPKPWTTEVIEVDLRPGGRAAMVMRGPDGEGGEPMDGVFLEVVPERCIVFTNALTADWRPRDPEPVAIVGYFAFAPDGERTRYTAGARHWSAEAMAKHEAMGFAEGWGMVADQLEAVARRVAEGR